MRTNVQEALDLMSDNIKLIPKNLTRYQVVGGIGGAVTGGVGMNLIARLLKLNRATRIAMTVGGMFPGAFVGSATGEAILQNRCASRLQGALDGIKDLKNMTAEDAQNVIQAFNDNYDGIQTTLMK